jgi:hypothetical protein
MSHALVASASPALDVPAVRELARALGGALQVIAFAAVLWLLAAGPGFLADSASTVAEYSQPER